MSKFEIYDMPGGEVIIARTLVESIDGVDDCSSFMLREDEQKQVAKWFVEPIEYLIDK